MASLIPGFQYDIFISYRHKDNKGERWVTDFVEALKTELESTFKEEVSVYFDENPTDGLLETYHVNKSLEGKLKCLIFIPIISQTYCDLKSFAWLHEFCAFNKLASNDSFGRDIKLLNGNVASRILPVKIHDIDTHDKHLIETEIGGILRSIDFIYKSSGVNRPLKRDDTRYDNDNHVFYRDQINKLANAIKEIIGAMRNSTSSSQFSEPSESPPAVTKKRNRIPVIITGTLFLFIVLSAAVYYFFIARNDQYLDKSIAVLPFIDLSQEHDLEYFSDGMMEEILNHLAKIEDLRVISRTSSMRYKEAKISVADIAKELGVTNILEGSVRKSGDRVRITVQLIDAATEKHLWSEDYDYLELKDIFAVQSDVSIQVAEILKAKLTDPVKASLKRNYTNDVQAYKFYVKGRYYWDKRTKQSFDSAEVYFKRAIEIDPQYALAYAGLADCYALDVRTMSLESIQMAKTYVDKALSLDSTLGEAWATMALIKSREYDWEGSKKTFERAIQLNPNYPVAYFFYGNVFFYTGDLQRGIKENKKALDLDPLSYPLNHVLGNHYVMTREYDLAIKQGLRFKAIFNYAPSFLGLSLLEERKYQEAIQIFANLPVSAVPHGLLLSYGYSKSGDKTKAKEELDKTLEQEGIRSYFWLAVAYIGLENYDLALTQLEKGYEMRDFAMNTIKVNPLVDPLRNEPRFKALLKKMNLN